MKRSFKRLAFGLFVVVALALLAVACGDDEESGAGGQTQFDGVIKIGLLGDLSGPGSGSPLILSTLKGFEVGVADINADGGVKVGDKRYEIKIIKIDTKANAVDTNAAAAQLIGEGVLGVGVHNCITFPPAHAQLKATGKIMMWTNCPPGLNLLDKDVPTFEGVEKNPLLFAGIDFTLPIFTGWLKWAKQNDPAIKTVAFLGDDSPLGRGQAAVLPAAAKAAGLEFLGPPIHFPAGTPDLASYLTDAKSRKADLVYMSSSGNLDGPTQAIKLNVAPRLMGPGLRPFDMTIIGDIGTTKVYMMDFRLPYHAEVAPDKYQDELLKLGTLDGGAPVQVGFAIAFYDFAFLLKQAIEKAQTTTDAALVAKAMVGLKVDSFMGGEVIMDADHAARGPTGMIVTTKDKFTVYTFENATADKPVDTFTVDR